LRDEGPWGKIGLKEADDQNKNEAKKKNLEKMESDSYLFVKWCHCGDQTKQFKLWFEHKNAHKWEKNDETQFLVEVKQTMMTKLSTIYVNGNT